LIVTKPLLGESGIGIKTGGGFSQIWDFVNEGGRGPPFNNVVARWRDQLRMTLDEEKFRTIGRKGGLASSFGG